MIKCITVYKTWCILTCYISCYYLIMPFCINKRRGIANAEFFFNIWPLSVSIMAFRMYVLFRTVSSYKCVSWNNSSRAICSMKANKLLMEKRKRKKKTQFLIHCQLLCAIEVIVFYGSVTWYIYIMNADHLSCPSQFIICRWF